MKKENEIDLYSDENLKIIYHNLEKMKYPFELKEELINEGFIALIKASEMYDPTKGKKFYSYGYMAVRNAMLMLLNKETKHNNISYDEIVNDEDGDSFIDLFEADEDEDLINIGEDKDFYDSTLARIKNPIYRFIFQRFYEENLSENMIAKLYFENTDIKAVETITRIIVRYTPKFND